MNIFMKVIELCKLHNKTINSCLQEGVGYALPPEISLPPKPFADSTATSESNQDAQVIGKIHSF